MSKQQRQIDSQPRVIRNSVRGWYRWHRRMGVAAAFFVLLLSVTGIILNHNNTLNLHKTYIQNDQLYAWYGLGTVEEMQGFAGISIDRVVLDVHSGRFFGAAGPWVMDLMALLFIILSISGIYMWWWRAREQKANRQKRIRRKQS